MSTNKFSNRWGIILAALGMAIGAGNLWRFPRLAGQYGGSFIVLWILFLFIWSIPILLAEFAIGRKFKTSVIGAFTALLGQRYAWMGFFVTVCSLGIAFYYSVVAAWAVTYFGYSVNNLVSDISINEILNSDPEYLTQQWHHVTNGNLITVAVYILVVLVTTFILKKGIKNGLEKANKVIIPSLFIMIIIILITGVSLPNGVLGLNHMFHVDISDFLNSRIWIEAVTQSAWSTGAGWGLMMTLSSYTQDNEDVTLNSMIGAFGNNTASLLAGTAIIPAVFALSASEEAAIDFLASGNLSLTFTIIPKLFDSFPYGNWLSVVFFMALFSAALSSLLAMVQLLRNNLDEIGLKPPKSDLIILSAFILFGFPSAYYLDFFSNQDWVWGVGLLLSGFFILVAVVKTGARKFFEKNVLPNSDLWISPKLFKWIIILNIPIAIGLIYWWLSRDYSKSWFNENGHWDLLGVYSNASTVTQWGLVILIGILLNNYLVRKFHHK